MHSSFDWNLTLPEQELFQKALKHFDLPSDSKFENEQARKLISSFENGDDLPFSRENNSLDDKLNLFAQAADRNSSARTKAQSPEHDREVTL